MATKSKRGRSAGKLAKVKTKVRAKAKSAIKAKPGMKAKAVKLLARISAKVDAAREDVKGRAQVGSKALAKAGAQAKATARRTFRKATAKASTQEHDLAAQLARNKALVLEFYKKLIGEKDYEAARPYMGEDYRQHAPYASDGHAGVAEWVRNFKETFPNHHYEVKKVIAEGDFVVLHLHGKSGPNPHGESVVDIFRIKDGKVIEHWDVIQPIPETADNANSMF
jgi:predicted SnoaL-like aldol condensation-catalyzing enzyme